MSKEFTLRYPSKSKRRNYNYKVKNRIKQIFCKNLETWLRVIDGGLVLLGLRRNKHLGDLGEEVSDEDEEIDEDRETHYEPIRGGFVIYKCLEFINAHSDQ